MRKLFSYKVIIAVVILVLTCIFTTKLYDYITVLPTDGLSREIKIHKMEGEDNLYYPETIASMSFNDQILTLWVEDKYLNYAIVATDGKVVKSKVEDLQLIKPKKIEPISCEDDLLKIVILEDNMVNCYTIDLKTAKVLQNKNYAQNVKSFEYDNNMIAYYSENNKLAIVDMMKEEIVYDLDDEDIGSFSIVHDGEGINLIYTTESKEKKGINVLECVRITKDEIRKYTIDSSYNSLGEINDCRWLDDTLYLANRVTEKRSNKAYVNIYTYNIQMQDVMKVKYDFSNKTNHINFIDLSKESYKLAIVKDGNLRLVTFKGGKMVDEMPLTITNKYSHNMNYFVLEGELFIQWADGVDGVEAKTLYFASTNPKIIEQSIKDINAGPGYYIVCIFLAYLASFLTGAMPAVFIAVLIGLILLALLVFNKKIFKEQIKTTVIITISYIILKSLVIIKIFKGFNFTTIMPSLFTHNNWFAVELIGLSIIAIICSWMKNKNEGSVSKYDYLIAFIIIDFLLMVLAVVPYIMTYIMAPKLIVWNNMDFISLCENYRFMV